MPSPLGRVAEQSEVGRGLCAPKVGIFLYPCTALFRHGQSRATFPKGEGFCCCLQEAKKEDCVAALFPYLN